SGAVRSAVGNRVLPSRNRLRLERRGLGKFPFERPLCQLRSGEVQGPERPDRDRAALSRGLDVLSPSRTDDARAQERKRRLDVRRVGRSFQYVGIGRDRKSTRLNSSHEWISYAVFCLKKKIA